MWQWPSSILPRWVAFYSSRTYLRLGFAVACTAVFPMNTCCPDTLAGCRRNHRVQTARGQRNTTGSLAVGNAVASSFFMRTLLRALSVFYIASTTTGRHTAEKSCSHNTVGHTESILRVLRVFSLVPRVRSSTDLINILVLKYVTTAENW